MALSHYLCPWPSYQFFIYLPSSTFFFHSLILLFISSFNSFLSSLIALTHHNPPYVSSPHSTAALFPLSINLHYISSFHSLFHFLFIPYFPPCLPMLHFFTPLSHLQITPSVLEFISLVFFFSNPLPLFSFQLFHFVRSIPPPIILCLLP